MPADEPTSTPSPSRPDVDAQIDGIAALGEPIRRDLYRYVIAQRAPVSRDEAAEGTGVPRHTAKFHLDRLVDDGLLDVEFARPPGRRGPGAGRPAKHYRRAARDVSVSLPQRDYELVGRLLARAVNDAQQTGRTVAETLGQAARTAGHNLGHRALLYAVAQPGGAPLIDAATTVLVDNGYEPRRDEAGVTLANCPFHSLAQEYTDLVCGMNLELMTGFVDELDGIGLEARLEPTPGQCCVRLCRPDQPDQPDDKEK